MKHRHKELHLHRCPGCLEEFPCTLKQVDPKETEKVATAKREARKAEFVRLFGTVKICDAGYAALCDNCDGGMLMLDENGEIVWPDAPMELKIIGKVETH